MSDLTTTTKPPRPAPLSATASITVGGTLWWVGLVWAAVLAILVVVLTVLTVTDASLDDSIWAWLGAGWQRWLVLLAGTTMVPTFGPMLITNGVTRARLSASATITMVVVAIAGGLFVVGGYLVETAFYESNDWLQLFDDEEVATGVGFLTAAGVTSALLLAAWFVSGWMMGAAVYHFGKGEGFPLVVPSLIPLLAVELLVESRMSNPIFGFVTNGLDAVGQPDATVGIPIAIGVIALSCFVATRVTRQVALHN